MNFKNIIGLILIQLSMVNCQPQADKSVQIVGELKKIVMNSDINGKIELKSLQNKHHLYALGALANLKGEILIFDSAPYITFVKDGNIELDRTFNHQATLLVFTQQDNWLKLEIPNNILTLNDLEKYIGETLTRQSISQAQPVPFLIRGTARTAQWHVIDWLSGDTVHTHEKHKASGLHGTLADEGVEILGFYSDKHHGIITHQTTNMHLHVKNQSGSIAGHLDDLSLDGGVTLYLPSNK